MCYCEGYSGLAVADYFIEKALEDKKDIVPFPVTGKGTRPIINNDFKFRKC